MLPDTLHLTITSTLTVIRGLDQIRSISSWSGFGTLAAWFSKSGGMPMRFLIVAVRIGLLLSSMTASAQFGPNCYWPLRGGYVMSWANPANEPGLPLVEQIPMGFAEGYSVFTAHYTPAVIVGDATGVRHGDGSFVKGSKRRVAYRQTGLD